MQNGRNKCIVILENVRSYVQSQYSFNDFSFGETQASNSNSLIFKSSIPAQHSPKFMMIKYISRMMVSKQ